MVAIQRMHHKVASVGKLFVTIGGVNTNMITKQRYRVVLIGCLPLSRGLKRRRVGEETGKKKREGGERGSQRVEGMGKTKGEEERGWRIGEERGWGRRAEKKKKGGVVF